jgi:hypothetical protein
VTSPRSYRINNKSKMLNSEMLISHVVLLQIPFHRATQSIHIAMTLMYTARCESHLIGTCDFSCFAINSEHQILGRQSSYIKPCDSFKGAEDTCIPLPSVLDTI